MSVKFHQNRRRIVYGTLTLFYITKNNFVPRQLRKNRGAAIYYSFILKILSGKIFQKFNLFITYSNRTNISRTLYEIFKMEFEIQILILYIIEFLKAFT